MAKGGARAGTALLVAAMFCGLAVADDKASEEGILAAIGSSLARTEQLLENAKKEKDVVKVNCILDKLGTLKGLTRVAEIAVANLKDAQERKDNDAANHERGKLDVAGTRARQLAGQAESCVGEISRYTGPIDVKVEVDALTAGEGDPAAAPSLSRVPELERPNAASPYL